MKMNKATFLFFDTVTSLWLGAPRPALIMMQKAYEHYLTTDPSTVFDSDEEQEKMYKELFGKDFFTMVHEIEVNEMTEEDKRVE